jgi:hypothetical protein
MPPEAEVLRVEVERETDAPRARFATGEMGMGWEEDQGAGPAGCEDVGMGVDMARMAKNGGVGISNDYSAGGLRDAKAIS